MITICSRLLGFSQCSKLKETTHCCGLKSTDTISNCTQNCCRICVFKCQAVDQSNREQRATKLVHFLSYYCNEASFSAFCESLIAVGQKGVVDTYFRRKDTGNIQTPGIYIALNYLHIFFDGSVRVDILFFIPSHYLRMSTLS